MTGINFDDGSYYSSDNIWFSNYKYKPVDFKEYDRPLLASNRSAIGNLKLVFQSAALKDKFEGGEKNVSPQGRVEDGGKCLRWEAKFEGIDNHRELLELPHFASEEGSIPRIRHSK